MSNTANNLVDIINDLDAGVFAQKMERAMFDVAQGVIDTSKSGKVTISFEFKRIASSNQVAVKHKLEFLKPTKNGKSREENTTETPMHVGVRGKLSLFPESQPELFDRQGHGSPSASDAAH
ncbi:hypothetical protein [Dyella sp. M7H15-1]|uniref:hypothetical protein n=1 Tax=Dyella sp. M7H15-1 TaxID=2501295 RepID=UPI001F0C8571|nr:hypothetical protein [Dyella sp. M7H15-1]